MKSIAKHVFVFMCAIALLFCLTGNLLGAVANASTSIVSSRDDYLVYDTAIKNGVAPVKMTYYFGQLHYGYMTNYSTFTYITFDNLELPVITINESQIYSTGCSNAYFLSQDNKGATVSYSSYMGNMKNLSKSGYDNSQVFYVTNAPKGSLDITNNANALIIYLDSEGNDVTNAVDKDDIVFEHYYNKLTDGSHTIEIANNSASDIYFTLKCVMPQYMTGNTGFEMLKYTYREKQLLMTDGVNYKYSQLSGLSAEQAATWISALLSSYEYEQTYYGLSQSEMYDNLMLDTFWHKGTYYSSGNIKKAYAKAMYAELPEWITDNDSTEFQSMLTRCENIEAELGTKLIALSGGTSTPQYQYTSTVKLNAGEVKTINVLASSIDTDVGEYYQFVFSCGTSSTELEEHSRSGFTVTTASTYIPPMEDMNDGANVVYDENGNIIGQVDENGNITLFDKDVENEEYTGPTISTTNVSTFFSSLKTYFNMFYGILPAPVMNVVIFGLSLLIAIGILKAVL